MFNDKILSEYRYEKKYVIPNDYAYIIPQVLATNKLRFIKQYDTRIVKSIYLDTDSLKFFKESKDGLCFRRKFRIRWYESINEPKIFNHKPTHICNPKLEIKIKNGHLGTKQVYPFDNKVLYENDSFIENLSSSLIELPIDLDIKNTLKILKPNILISYKRLYFISRFLNCRLTVDSGIRFSLVNNSNYIFRKSHVFNNTIVELKYPNDPEISGFIRSNLSFPFRTARYSKYTSALNYFISDWN